jgi:hypothetical protein
MKTIQSKLIEDKHTPLTAIVVKPRIITNQPKNLQEKLTEVYPRQAKSPKKKKILFEIHEWESKMIDEIQSTYLSECGEELTTTQIVRTALQDHIKKMSKTIHWHRGKKEKHNKTQQN